jgi:ABC-type nitrate/sulfonate/bicarbonate transport system substrate-binding protein
MRASVSDHGSPTLLDRRAALRLLSGAALASAAGITPTRSARAQALVPIQIGIQIFTGAVATVWAEKKLYEKHRLTVEAKQMADGRTVRDAMVAGQLNAGTMNITPFIVGAAAASLTMVAVVSLGGDTVGVVVRKGGSIRSLADLKGKRVGISVGSTTGNIFVQTVAPQAGLKPGDYHVVNMRPPDQVAALAAGSVDAITSFEPYLTIAEQEGIGVTLLRFGGIDPNPTCLVLTPTLIERSPETVKAFLKSWLDGVDYWRSHTAQVVDVLVQLSNSAGYANVTRDVAEAVVQQIKVEPNITPALAAHIKGEAERMKAANLIRALPDWSKVLRPDLLAQAKG